MLSWAAIGFIDFQGPFYDNFKDLYMAGKFGSQFVVPAIFFGLLTIYAGIFGRIPRQVYAFLAVGVILNVLLLIFSRSFVLGIAVYVYIAFAAIEILRMQLYSWIKKRHVRRATLIGFSLFMLAIIYQLLSNLNYVPRIGEYGIAYIYGLLALSLSVSLDLSLNFARTSRNLQKQLQQVKQLSEKNLKQERRMREQAIKRKILEADNERKTRELEEARHLQLSMLPSVIPAPKHLEIAAEMRTANEVGGDYYDFSLGKDHNLTVAIGDATGHGMKAGTMVASVKSLFAAFGDQPDIRKFFNRCTDIIKEMQMGNIFMGMMLVRFNSHIVTAAAAGMPPILIFRAKTGIVDEIIMKGMPLGASRNFEYQQKKTEIEEGDTILLMTDGFPELFNKNKEMYDYPRLKEKFAQIAGHSAQNILDELIEAGEAWRKEEPQADDYTFVVVKVKKQTQ
jgi:serine phosphatase RsbU (regulator of sigma subunit)